MLDLGLLGSELLGVHWRLSPSSPTQKCSASLHLVRLPPVVAPLLPMHDSAVFTPGEPETAFYSSRFLSAAYRLPLVESRRGTNIAALRSFDHSFGSVSCDVYSRCCPTSQKSIMMIYNYDHI